MRRIHKIAYSAGSLGTALSMQCFNTFILRFYVDELKLLPSLYGIGMTIYAIWNAINDPLAGQISDRTRTRWGRRIPYVAFLTIPLSLCFIAVWTPPFRVELGQMALLFAYFLIAIHLFDTLWTFVVLNWTALFPEMYPDESERAEVSGWRQLFSIIGLIVGIALPPFLFERIGWAWMAVIFAFITALSFFLSLLGSKERKEFSLEEALRLGEALRATFASRSFRLFLVANLFIQFVFMMLTASITLYAKYVLEVGGMEQSILLGIAFLVAMPALYIWTKVTQTYGARNALLASLVAFAAGIFPFLFAGSFTAALLTMAAGGVGLAGLIMLVDVLLAAVIDEDEIVTGKRREGMFFGINGFIIRFSIAMQAIVTSIVLIITKYDAHLAVGEQPASALLGLRLLVSVIPIIGLAIAFLATRAYPLYGERLEQVKAEVEKLHREKGVANP